MPINSVFRRTISRRISSAFCCVPRLGVTLTFFVFIVGPGTQSPPEKMKGPIYYSQRLSKSCAQNEKKCFLGQNLSHPGFPPRFLQFVGRFKGCYRYADCTLFPALPLPPVA